jgi:hypothetical protein
MCTDYFQYVTNRLLSAVLEHAPHHRIIDAVFLNVDAYYVFSSRAYRDCKKQWVRLAPESI